jgi:8-oxo-dGTP pyrophosphatase MutT (NUDIX family)
LLQQRCGTGYLDGYWVAGAAGHIELRETAAGCAVREASEELGVMVREADLTPLTVMQRTDGTDDPQEQRVDWFFSASVWSGEPRVLEPAKCAGIAWHRLDDLPAMVPDYEREVLRSLAARAPLSLSTHGF